MARLIIVPQYPTPLRYQEWWWDVFPREFSNHFSDVMVLGSAWIEAHGHFPKRALMGSFSNVNPCVLLETEQIREYMNLELQKDDVLLLNDLSYPGLFAHVLFHKRPGKCFTICHATSINYLDIFYEDRGVKFPIETNISMLFDKIFVATEYHKQKLKWPNVFVNAFPEASTNHHTLPGRPRVFDIVSVARNSQQKRDRPTEKFVEERFGKIMNCSVSNWLDYFQFLDQAQVMLITSQEETFGYQVIDAIRHGVIPIAPRRCSYPELLPDHYLYEDVTELYDKLKLALGGHLTPLKNAKTHQQSECFFANLSYQMKWS